MQLWCIKLEWFKGSMQACKLEPTRAQRGSWKGLRPQQTWVVHTCHYIPAGKKTNTNAASLVANGAGLQSFLQSSERWREA